MVVTTVYVTRHGYRSNWLKDVPIPDPPTGLASDPVLAPHGEDQARELGKFLIEISPPIDRVYSSPFYRCLQTARPTATGLNQKVYVENGIGEWYVKGRSELPTPVPVKLLKGFFDEIDESYTPVIIPSTEGETVAELHDRCKLALSKLIGNINEKDPHVKTILLVTHAAPKAAIGPGLTGDHKTLIRTGTCSLDKYELINGREGTSTGDWTMTMNGNTEFLSHGEEMHWGFDNPYEPGSTEDIRARQKQEKLDNRDVEETATVYIPLEMSEAHAGSVGMKNTIPTQATFQSSGLETGSPLFKIGETIYKGEWNDMVGTEIFTSPSGEIIGKSRQRIVLQNDQVSYKDDNTRQISLLEKIKHINDCLDGKNAALIDKT